MEHEKLTSLNQGSPNGMPSGVAASEAAFASVLASALLDGELRDEEFVQACVALGSDGQARQRWRDFHVLGEALRHGEASEVVRAAAHASRTQDEVFLSRLRGQLAEERPGAGLRGRLSDHQPYDLVPDRRRATRAGANDAYGAWRLTAGLCALMVVGMLGWQGVAGLHSAAQTRQLTQARPDARPEARSPAGRQGVPGVALVRAPVPSMFTPPSSTAQPFMAESTFDQESSMVMLRDPRLDHLMARQGALVTNGRYVSEGQFASPRLGRSGVAAQGVLVNLEKGPASPR